jgi:hypothetical protein
MKAGLFMRDTAHAINIYKIGSTMDYFLRFVAPRGARK